MRPFRFSCNVFGLRSRDEFVRYCRDVERFGFHTLFTADHLGSPAPFSPLVLAAQVTERLRVGTMVLNVPFWNAHLLAREVATADVLTDGRLELGVDLLGAHASHVSASELTKRRISIGATLDAIRAAVGERTPAGGLPCRDRAPGDRGQRHRRPGQRRPRRGEAPRRSARRNTGSSYCQDCE